MKYKSHATISTNKRRTRVVSYLYRIRMRIITSVSYPLRNKRKQAIAVFLKFFSLGTHISLLQIFFIKFYVGNKFIYVDYFLREVIFV